MKIIVLHWLMNTFGVKWNKIEEAIIFSMNLRETQKCSI